MYNGCIYHDSVLCVLEGVTIEVSPGISGRVILAGKSQRETTIWGPLRLYHHGYTLGMSVLVYAGVCGQQC